MQQMLPVGKNYSSLCDVLYGKLSFAVVAGETTNCPRQMITFQWPHCNRTAKLHNKLAKSIQIRGLSFTREPAV